MFGLSAQRVANLPWESALARVLTEFGSSLLPSRILEWSLRDHQSETVDLIRGGFAIGKEIRGATVIVTAKSARGFRPVHVLGLDERVFYEALLQAFAPPLHVPDRSEQAYDAFARGPLTLDVADSNFVVRSDVSSFYQYVDHRTLETQLVGSTGKADLATALRQFLRAIVGRSYGLPQTNPSSHTASDVYIDVVERRLRRVGHSVWRYNDDFASGVRSHSEARRFLRDFEQALREIGLTPNDDKSRILPREAYAKWVDAPAERRRQLAASLDIDDFDAWLTEPDSEYADEDDMEADGNAVVDAELADREDALRVEGSVRALAQWREYLRFSGVKDPLEMSVTRALARDAIRVLRKRKAREGMDYCEDLLLYEPQLTHVVCRYLRAIAGEGDPAPAELVAALVARSDVDVSDWQAIWFLEPLWKSGVLPVSLRPWIESLAERSTVPELLRARAAFTLARHHWITVDGVGSLFDVVDSAARPDLVAAQATLAETTTDPALVALTAESPIYGLVAQYVLADQQHA